MYRVKRAYDARQVSVHLAHRKRYHHRQTPPAPQLDKLAECFTGKRIPLLALDEKSADQPKIERYIVQKVVGHKPGRGQKSPHNHVYRLRSKGYGPKSDLTYRAEEVPQCHEMILAYRSQHE